MAVAGLIDILDELGAQIRTVMEETTDVDVQVEGRMVVSPTPPTIDVYPGDVSRFPESAGFGLLDDRGGYQFTVRARVATGDSFAGQDLLLAFMDDTNALCIASALQDDPTLNGLASSVSAQDPTGYVIYPEGDAGSLLGFQFTCVVLPAES